MYSPKICLSRSIGFPDRTHMNKSCHAYECIHMRDTYYSCVWHSASAYVIWPTTRRCNTRVHDLQRTDSRVWHCNTLQHTYSCVSHSASAHVMWLTATRHNTLIHALQRTAPHVFMCVALQHTATHVFMRVTQRVRLWDMPGTHVTHSYTWHGESCHTYE